MIQEAKATPYLYEILKDFTEYEFIQFCSIELKQEYGYSVFEVKRKKQ